MEPKDPSECKNPSLSPFLFSLQIFLLLTLILNYIFFFLSHFLPFQATQWNQRNQVSDHSSYWKKRNGSNHSSHLPCFILLVFCFLSDILSYKATHWDQRTQVFATTFLFSLVLFFILSTDFPLSS